MDKCCLTSEQIQLLMNGQRVLVSYPTLEEYGRVDQHEIELVPPEKIYCKRCEQPVKEVNNGDICIICEKSISL